MVFKLFRLSDVHQRLKETALKAKALRVKQLTRPRLNIARYIKGTPMTYFLLTVMLDATTCGIVRDDAIVSPREAQMIASLHCQPLFVWDLDLQPAAAAARVQTWRS